MVQHPCRAVVFDFDLTLADSSAAVVECITYALQQLRVSAVPEQRMRQTIGLSLPATFRYLTGRDEAQLVADFGRYFVQRADQVMVDMTPLYPDVPAVLASLRAAGLHLGIVSSKFRYRIEDILTRAALRHHFDIIVGGEDVTQHKPHPEGLLRALTHLAQAPAQAVYVGDHAVDAEAASRAGVPFVAVLTGPCDPSHFVSFPLVGMVQNLTGLPRLVGAC